MMCFRRLVETSIAGLVSPIILHRRTASSTFSPLLPPSTPFSLLLLEDRSLPDLAKMHLIFSLYCKQQQRTAKRADDSAAEEPAPATRLSRSNARMGVEKKHRKRKPDMADVQDISAAQRPTPNECGSIVSSSRAPLISTKTTNTDTQNVCLYKRLPHLRTTMPCLRVVRRRYSSSLSLEHSLLASLYPHLLPPQSSLTRLPARVIP